MQAPTSTPLARKCPNHLLASSCVQALGGLGGANFSNLDECFIDIEFLGSPGRPGTFLVSTIVCLGLCAYLAKPAMPHCKQPKKMKPCKTRTV